jgi:hypothetical protein
VESKTTYTPKEQEAAVVKLDKTPVELEIRWNTPGTGDKPSDWSVSVKVVNGGIIESHDVFMYEAPSSGYQPEWRFEANGKSVESLKPDFYIVASDGAVYGRLAMFLKPYMGKEREMSVRYWINPNGSRNLLTEKGD